jgi:hypothetical protein
MPRIGWFGSAQRRVTAFPTAETFNSARHLLTHCHPTRHATPVHTCKTNEKEKLKINLTDWIRSISFAARTNLISYFFLKKVTRQTEGMKHKEEDRRKKKKKKKKVQVSSSCRPITESTKYNKLSNRLTRGQ